MKSVPLITGGLSLLLSACSGGGGSFDVDDVSNPSSSKPRYQDDTSNQRTKSNLQKLSIPSLGGGMKLVAQNLRGDKEPSLLNNEDGYMIFSSLSTIKKDVKENNKNEVDLIGSINEPNATNPTENDHGQKYVYSGLYYIPSWYLNDSNNNKLYFGYYGYAFYYGNKTATNLPVGGVAKYKGTWDFITATKNGKQYSLFSNNYSKAYSKRSATPGDIDSENDSRNGETGLISEFSVDFGEKKLTGELYYNKRKTNVNPSANTKHTLYNLEADVYSNRFRGKVIPKEPESTEHPFTKEGTLEGGFYGPNAEELGGKFLAGDNRVFGVFSAKEEEKKDKKLSRETLIDGKLTTFKRTDATTSTTASTTTDTTTNATTDATANTAANATTDATANTENFTTKDIPSFGEADYLLIDNYPIPLLPENSGDFISSKHHKVGDKTYKVEACCNNLSYVKFGIYYEDKPIPEEEQGKEKQTTKDKEKQTAATTNTYYQFLLGQRTASSEIPKMGSVKYHGSWFGYITDGKTSYSTTGDKQRDNSGVSDFDVNFDNKKLTGTLKRHDTGNTVFSIDADFKKGGNAFEGTATAKDLVIDGNNSQTSNTKINITTEVKGAFYGPKASELGGYFTYNGKDTITKNTESSSAVPSSPNSQNARAAVVFGARQQVETTK
ncbi:TPA: transferrin-binding protein-like solute binding protein [Haemophilus influenzae]|uniref:transferrin-binding protein-like solute binding protein n=1 Tax=Haemophilus influenzae TaxID=727 RepID=UPI000E57D875|nr:transferrin-binding protein-like solute binding protein [Haemophilus influenzae]MCK9132125.1 transferrin-binding protein-like solute binding protein [Haemophilus influenzae]MCK9135122.1 transferrin-binding protein-like solute binding protein [Haemophilus influenzae]MCK9138537.1 transferrin-binding protein-like solute binding protein [Haemophilus influenzae]MCK9144628.1 transferrin-binding protein-like solute binding protein [Haemophilus influenzae]